MYSHLVICSDFANKIARLKQNDCEFVTIDRDEILIDDAKLAIEKAHISSEKQKCIIICAPKFSEIAQNKLLKVIEEPPGNVVFVLLGKSRSSFLQTILSRLPVVNEYQRSAQKAIPAIEKIDLAYVYDLLTANKFIKAAEAKEIFESHMTAALQSRAFVFEQKDYEQLQRLVKLLDLGSPARWVLSTAMLQLLQIKAKTQKAGK